MLEQVRNAIVLADQVGEVTYLRMKERSGGIEQKMCVRYIEYENGCISIHGDAALLKCYPTRLEIQDYTIELVNDGCMQMTLVLPQSDDERIMKFIELDINEVNSELVKEAMKYEW